MDHRPLDTVLVVCGCPENAGRILEDLHQGGFGVLGPVATTGLALTLASQTAPTIALVATPPEGRRDAVEFGRSLMDLWGVRTWVLPGASDEDEIASASWAAQGARLSRLKTALRPLEAEVARLWKT